MSENKVEFIGFDPFIKQSRQDKGWKVEIDTSQDEYVEISKLPLMQDVQLKITVEIVK